MKEIIVLPTGQKKVRTINKEPSLTQQHHKDECDINNILKKYKRTGQITHLARSQGVYADLSTSKDYFEAVLTVQNAQKAFDTLPSETRKRFGHNPAQLLDFINNDKNYDECVKMGLIDKKPNLASAQQPITPPASNDSKPVS